MVIGALLVATLAFSQPTGNNGWGVYAPIQPNTVLCNSGSSMATPGACKDIYVPAIDAQQLEIFGVTAVAGNAFVQFTQGSWSSADVGKLIVVTGIGTAGAPLATTITSYTNGGSFAQIGLATTVVTSVTSATEWVGWGHDDAPNINTGVACTSTGIPHVILTSAYYLIGSQITLPQGCRIELDGGGATIVAGAAMTRQIYQAGNGAFNFFATVGSSVHDLKLDGMGVVTENIDFNGFGWNFRNIAPKNATTVNLLCDSTCENNTFSVVNTYNDSIAVPTFTTYGVEVLFTDNHFVDLYVSGVSASNFYDDSAGNYWINAHGYNNTTGPIFLLAGSGGILASPYADSIAAGTEGINITGNNYLITGARLYAPTYTNQIGIQLGSSVAGNVIIGGGCYNSFTAANCILQQGNTTSGPRNNIVIGVSGSNYSSLGSFASSICLGLSNACNGAESVSIGQFNSTNFGNVSIGHANQNTGSNSYGEGTESSDQGRSGTRCYANGEIAAFGDSQICDVVLFGKTTSTAAFRLTSDGTGTASSINCGNIPNNGLWGIDIDATAVDTASVVTNYGRWHWGSTAGVGAPMLIRGSSAATTALAGTSSTQSVTVAGTATSGALTLSADTTNGCVNLTWTAPNSDQWFVRAHLHTLE